MAVAFVVCFGAVEPLRRTDVAREPLVPVQNEEGLWGFARRGELVVPFRYDNVYPFSEGLAVVRGGLGEPEVFIDESGRDHSVGVEFVSTTPFYRGTATVRQKSGLWGIINRSGAWVFPPILHSSLGLVQEVYHSNTPKDFGWLNADGKLVRRLGHSERVRVQFDEFWSAIDEPQEGGVLDTDPPVFSEGLATKCVPFRDGWDVELRRCGVIDTSHRWVVPPTLSSPPSHFVAGLLTFVTSVGLLARCFSVAAASSWLDPGSMSRRRIFPQTDCFQSMSIQMKCGCGAMGSCWRE